MTIEIESLSHAYGSQAILQEISITVAHGEVLCVLGPSGSGKTTALSVQSARAQTRSDCVRERPAMAIRSRELTAAHPSLRP